jgi:LCP family protein required for cell wall assembly
LSPCFTNLFHQQSAANCTVWKLHGLNRRRVFIVTEPHDGDSGARKPLPPELDPRRSAPSRRATRSDAGSGESAAAGGAGGAGGGSLPPGEYRSWGPRWIRRWTRRRLFGSLAGSLIALFTVIVIIVVVALFGILGAIHKKKCDACESALGGKGLNILVIGSDSRAGLTKAQEKSLHVGSDVGQRSDTMILVHFPADGGKADMVSLPRDSYVTIPAHCNGGATPKHGKCSNGAVIPAAQNKINAAYSLGGANLTVRTVEDNTNVPISHYVEINFLGFVQMVDKLGGVTVCDSTAINDPVRRQGAGYVGSGLDIPAGKVTLSGPQSLEYVRAREFDPTGDLGRIQRQQKFMAAMLNKAESTGTLLNVPKLLSFLHAVASSLTTDSALGSKGEINLAKKLHSMSPKNVTLLTVPLGNTNYSTPAGDAVLWDPVLSKRLFTDFRNDTSIHNVIRPSKLTIAPSSIALKVLNATSKNGLAARAGTALSGLGFTVSSTGDAPKGSNSTDTVVLYGATRAESARTVAAAVTGSLLKEDDSLGTGLELIVGTSYEGVKKVTVSTGTSNRPTVTTGASNPCSST